MYNLESLAEINQGRRINETDVLNVNRMIEIIESKRDNKMPVVGDIVKYTNKYGNFYKHANINKYDKEADSLSICESPYVPFVEDNYISTSGGAWEWINRSEFTLIGIKETGFNIWGHMGAMANGAVYFKAKVNYWECNINEQNYSTEFYNRQYISVSEKLWQGYKYHGNGIAFRNDEDFNAWVKTFKGIIEKGYSENQLIVWYYRNIDKRVSLEEYKAINGIEDTFLCNGVRECKRIYDDQNKSIVTYFSWDIPELNWQTNREYKAARFGGIL